ncbi:MAG TPA: hypothetical protein VKJ65_02365 [Phycisphaerae bacterium]|nr:hypothetical protein [Phycisphaerae bacterium]
MSETLGSLCDKLTIVKLKQWHTTDPKKLKSLAAQKVLLEQEIDQFVKDAFAGRMAIERITFAANKVYKKRGNAVDAVNGELGEMISRLAQTNCALWHVQEKVYDFERVPNRKRCDVIKKLALLNLERTQYIDAIDKKFLHHVIKKSRLR